MTQGESDSGAQKNAALPDDPSEEHVEDGSTGWVAAQLHDVAKRRPGTAPGELRSDPDAMPVSISVFQFSADSFDEVRISHVSQIQQYAQMPSTTWVNVDGLRDTEVIAAVGEMFGIHRLVLEDVVSPHQRAKAERYDDQLVVVARMPQAGADFDTEQISIVLCPDAVITFQERRGDCLDPVRQRLRSSGGRIRFRGHDYLMYALLDTIIDSYFPVLAKLRQRLDEAERRLMAEPSVDVVALLQRIRTILFVVRTNVAPHQELVSHLLREPGAISADTQVYLRDCADHVAQVLDACETTRELAADLRDYCFAEISFNQNETMKTLTVMASIFIPLSFVAGFYGMNFDPAASPWNMPETRWDYGYPFAILVMAVITGLTLFGLSWMKAARNKARRRRFRNAQKLLR